MKVHLKTDVICTLFLVIILCLLIYLHFDVLSPRERQEKYTFGPLTNIRISSTEAVKTIALEDDISVTQNEHRCEEKDQVVDKSLPSASATTVTPPSSFNFHQYLLDKDKRHFQLLINQPRKCRKASNDPFLLIAIKSVLEDFERREVVRKTWGKEGQINGLEVRCIFLLAVPKNQTALPLWRDLAHYESETYGDILLWEFLDTFFNLTLKEIHFLKWAHEFCSNVKFIFKGDADVFVNTENIINFLNSYNANEDLFVGDIILQAQPIRSKTSKYYIPEIIYGQGLYPSYAGGGGFLMSAFTMKKLFKACNEVELFPIDDVFLGMCLLRTGLKPVAHEGFRTFGIIKPSAAPHLQTYNPCFYKELMVVHSLKVAEIWLMWKLLHDPTLTCTQKEVIERPFRWKQKS
ncbi:UDP-GlcNAc:betaGal beta-1,3-N-acetylglucosaminyltransferase 9 [Protopterus annectens]|uniref:UDP-GlcNAc:betaGal beta-1,3-N-acetylglucosaminyltransferase 9 n=1 Tax=Protopterus annectens TaxID=7888 RepID=UPI001CFBEBBE|nr:UDP-GlcNAc:betaGal beta-1,3-N-acetylglucosaminyltransferase 9 [Protopterus annectens]